MSRSLTLFPNDFISLKTNKQSFSNCMVALEPRTTSKVYGSFQWPAVQTIQTIDNEIRLVNTTASPIYIPKNEQICQVRATHIVDKIVDKNLALNNDFRSKKSVIAPSDLLPPFSRHVVIDPNDQLSNEWKEKFVVLNKQFDSVFEPVIGRYNDKSGRLRAHINFGPVLPPSLKLHAPCYGRDNLQILQDKFDELETQGVFARPEDMGVVVQAVSASFLVRKSSGDGYRLVTAFTSLSEYIKP